MKTTRTPLGALCVLALLPAGCNQILGIGDVHGGAGTTDAPPGTPDSRPGAIDAPGIPADARFVGPIALAAASDFQHTGTGGVLDLGTGAVTMDALPAAIGRDPVVRFTGALMVIVNRYGDNGIVLVDPSSLAIVQTIATGAGTNPQDAAIADGKVFVPTLGSAGVQVYDVGKSGTGRLIDLSGFDSDGMPDCESAFATPSAVFVTCDLLDAAGTPRGPGKVAVIDPTTETLSSSFDLPFANPFGFLTPTVGGGVGGEFLIGTAPSFTDFSTGCIARIKITGTPAANGCLVSNQTLGGYASTMTIDSLGSTVWATTGADLLRAVTYPAGSESAVSIPDGYAVSNVTGCNTGDLVMTWTSTSTSTTGGFQVYRAGSGFLYPSPKTFGMQPSNIDALACD